MLMVVVPVAITSFCCAPTSWAHLAPSFSAW